MLTFVHRKRLSVCEKNAVDRIPPSAEVRKKTRTREMAQERWRSGDFGPACTADFGCFRTDDSMARGLQPSIQMIEHPPEAG